MRLRRDFRTQLPDRKRAPARLNTKNIDSFCLDVKRNFGCHEQPLQQNA